MYFWFDVILEMIDKIFCGMILGDYKDFFVSVFGLVNFEFFCILLYDLCKVICVVFKIWGFEVIFVKRIIKKVMN